MPRKPAGTEIKSYVKSLSFVLILKKVEEDNERIYAGEFADYPEIVISGRTIEEAMERAALGLEAYFGLHKPEGLIEPSKIDEVYPKVMAKNQHAIVTLVSCNPYLALVRKCGSVKKTLTIPLWLNEIAENHGEKYSELLKTALIEDLMKRNLSDDERRLLEAGIN